MRRNQQMELVVFGDEELIEKAPAAEKHSDDELDEGISGYFGFMKSKDDVPADELNEVSEREAIDYDTEPGNFHLGSHHFSASGVKYFSATCQACKDFVAATHNSKISQGSEFRSNTPLIRASSGNLAQAHSAIDVQCCSSTTCEYCCTCRSGLGAGARTCPIHSKAGSVAFIKTGGATFFTCHEIVQQNSKGKNGKNGNSSSKKWCLFSPRSGGKKKRGFFSKSSK